MLEAVTVLGPGVDGGLAEDVDVSLDAEQVSRLRDAVAEAADLAEQLAAVAGQLPSGRVEVRYDDVRAGAAGDLGEGPIDPQRALLAAGVLDVESGWAALAEALSSSDAYLAWDETTVEHLLGRFRGAERQLVRHAIAEAGLAPDDVFAKCPSQGIARLAAVLQHYSGRTAL